MAFVLVPHLDPEPRQPAHRNPATHHRHAGGRGTGPDGGDAQPRLCHPAQPRHGHLPWRAAALRAGTAAWPAHADRRLPALAGRRSGRTRHRHHPLRHRHRRHPGSARHPRRRRCQLVQEPATAKYDGMPQQRHPGRLCHPCPAGGKNAADAADRAARRRP